jgi:hypothetical protein
MRNLPRLSCDHGNCCSAFGSGRPAGREVNSVASFDTPGRNPEHPRSPQGIDSPSFPPGDFVSEAVIIAVMRFAQGYRELVAYLASHCAELSEPEMVGVSRASSAEETRLRCHEFEVGHIAMAPRLADRKFAFSILVGVASA